MEESTNTPLIQCPILREDLVQTVGETCRGSLLKNNRYIACDDSCLVNIPFAVLCKTFCVYGYNIHDYINTSIYIYICIHMMISYMTCVTITCVTVFGERVGWWRFVPVDLYRWDTLNERSCDNLLPTKAGNGTGPAFFVLQSGGKK